MKKITPLVRYTVNYSTVSYEMNDLAKLVLVVLVFLGLLDPDPDPLVRGTDPDPDHSIIKQKK
jgi:hypothetical protein